MKNRTATEQDIAAGGKGRRQIYIRSGDLVTVSLELVQSGTKYAVSLRFKSGVGFKRLVGHVEAKDRAEALKKGWKMLRESSIVEERGWRWGES